LTPGDADSQELKGRESNILPHVPKTRGYGRVVELFQRAVALEGKEREAFLEAACEGDGRLRQELDSLLEHDVGEMPTEDSRQELPMADLPSNEPRTFGRYRVLEEIGRGGMAVVYLAEQRQPVRRRVALKVVKVGMDTRELIRRFESERQVLALMSHANIADVYDAGSTENGRPYFAMEYVDGVPITEYCDKFRLGVRERLELFCAVCQGVQHAHQKGVIHRDLKPSNVLVRIEGESPVPKIIDFGVAKAIAKGFTEETLNTRFGHLIGTPAYMSPEQAQPTVHDIDTRADVYALGVLLYELLVGRLPFEPVSGHNAVDEIRRLVAEMEPVRPSTRVAAAGADREEIAVSRSVEPSALTRRLRGDLDWIVLKALEKDRTRRYSSASELAQDIERHLVHEPVLASPPTASYRLRKFARRHRWGVAATAVLVVSMMLGIAGTTLGLLRARDEAQTSTQTLRFVTNLFDELDPARWQGEALTALELLDRGAEQASRAGQYKPLVRARLLDTIGDLYVSLGEYEASLPLLEEALALRRLELAEGHLDIAESRNGLANILYRLERYEESESLALQALASQEKHLGPKHFEVALTLNTLGLIEARRGEAEKGRALMTRALDILADVPVRDNPEQARAMNESANLLNSLGAIYLRQGMLSEADAAYARALEIRERYLDPEHPDLATSLHNYGLLLLRLERMEEAILPLERALRVRERVLGRDHVRVAGSLSVLGEIHHRLGNADRAESSHRRALEIRLETYGEDHSLVAQSLYNLSEARLATGRLAEAEALMRRSLATIERADGLSSTVVLMPLRALARQRHAAGDVEEAQTLIARAIDIAQKQSIQDDALLSDLRREYAVVSLEPGAAR